MNAAAIIRVEQPGDESAIADVHTSAFGRAGEAGLVAAIRSESGFDARLSQVAIAEGEVVGHILFSPIQILSEGFTAPALALAPMAVIPTWQGRGVGSALVRRGLEGCREAGHRIVVVLGHPEFYRRFGFERADRHNLPSPFSVPPEAFMVLALIPGALASVRGTVDYPAFFHRLT